MIRRLAVIGVTVTSVVAATVVVQVVAGSPQARADGLVPYAGCDDFLTQAREELRKTASSYGVSAGSGAVTWAVPAASEGMLAMTDGSTDTAQSLDSGVGKAAESGSTGTNLQEAGVDEPDVAKLADGRILTIDEATLRVRSTGPKPQLVGSLDLSASGFASFQPGELLVVGTRAVVVQTGGTDAASARTTSPSPGALSGKKSGVLDQPGEVQVPATRVSLVDLSAAQPRLLETATYDGTYVSARLVGGTVRLVTSFRPTVPGVMANGARGTEAEALATNRRIAATVTVDDVLPHVVHRAGTTTARTQAVDCGQVSRPREDAGGGMLVVSTLRPGTGLQQVDREAVMTDGELVYASTDRLYVATSRQWFQPMPMSLPLTSSGAEGDAASIAPTEPQEPTTQIHAFDTTDDDSTRYVGSGTVPGYVQGRWAFSEHEGTLRVATTRRPASTTNGGAADSSVVTTSGASSSMVVKLRETDGGRLVETGRVSGLGKTEEIKAVRYFGDLAAVVTFRQTDPLYLVDLSGKPRVVGELKVPGFSTYLHPIGDGLMLAIGMDADANGQTQGNQVSVFDVNDPADPTLVDRLSIGQGESAATYDSRAFSYDPTRRVLLVPLTPWDYASTTVVPIRVAKDGTLTRTVSVEMADAPDPDNGIQPVQRVLIDDDNFYGVSTDRVVAGDLDTLLRTS